MAERGDEAERGHQRGAAEVQRRHRVVDEGHRAAHQQEVRHHRVEQQHSAALLVADLADDDRGDGGEDRSPIAARWPAVSAVPPGRSTTMTPTSPAATATERRQPTVSPRIGIASSVMQQRRREDDRVGLRQRQAREGVEDQAGRDHRRAGAQRRPPGMPRPEVAVDRIAHQHDGDDREAEQRREEDDLERRVALAEELHHHVVGRVDAEGGQREGGAAGVGMHRRAMRRQWPDGGAGAGKVMRCRLRRARGCAMSSGRGSRP